jgi:hypothetical protein
LQEETAMLNVLTGDPDLCHPEDAKYSKQQKKTTSGTYLRQNQDTGQLTEKRLPDLVDFCIILRTNWNDFRHLINERLILSVSLNTEDETEAAVKFSNNTMQWAGWNATPEHTNAFKTCQVPVLIKQRMT